MRLVTSALLALLAVAACSPDAPEPDAGADEAAPAAAPEPAGTVTITFPTQGAELPAGPLEVSLEVSGVRIVQAGDTTSGTGHHHLYLDEDLAPMDQPVPSVPGRIVHMGDGSTTYTFENVEPGEHRLIAVVADGVHVPLDPPVVDTVTFVVR
jgi:hypothetical protein